MNVKEKQAAMPRPALGGLTGWLAARFSPRGRTEPRLAVLERIPLAPRQFLALVEAEGRRFLVATSAEGTPAFHVLDARPARVPRRGSAGRVSW